MNTMPCVFKTHAVVATDGFQAYLNRINTIPLLTEEEEKRLFKRFQEQNDLEAARRIVMAHLRYVVFIAKGYSGYGLPVEDLVQEGNVGLMKSVKKFDLTYGVRLATFAAHWIKAEIHEYVLRNWRLIKVATTKAQRKLFFNLRKFKKRLTRLTRDEAKKIATDLNVDTRDVLEMESRLRQADCFFDESFGDIVGDEAYDSLTAKITCLEDHSTRPDVLVSQDEVEQNGASSLYRALDALDERSRDIIQRRWLSDKKAGLKELSQHYEVSMERIRQIETRAMEQIKRFMSADCIPFAPSA